MVDVAFLFDSVLSRREKLISIIEDNNNILAFRTTHSQTMGASCFEDTISVICNTFEEAKNFHQELKTVDDLWRTDKEAYYERYLGERRG